MNGRFIMVISKRLHDEVYHGWLFETELCHEIIISFRDSTFGEKEPDVVLMEEPLLGDRKEAVDKLCDMLFDVIKARQDHFVWLRQRMGAVA